ncbi:MULTISPECIES: microviridin/marinostatin family tricyclic proteinase inhibitor [Polyangium]|uniref:Microviridin/marinostatin family tricyclic proteinase inhibitor n=2 Tax=Polyangium TaxID=55 RepID=A0A4V5PKX3_9BACT|nr:MULTISPECIES: microviridin/marinostatin family tricyclic proteinase inhibitor [Polyangium]MDI1435741.1 microviridin/marinostatin family tricyclic proteinase inhibitor [Polyangium sorediatum]TKC97224.1 microviridin/marinostatin family tricyclic proteinase inhibitor [Polyangium fumosum]
MSLPNDEENMTPLFAHLLVDDEQTQSTEMNTSGGTNPAPTYHCLDSECTKKYPSDADDCYTYKPSCDYF